NGRLDAVLQVELGEDACHMVLDGVLAKRERAADLLVARAAGKPLEDVELTLGEHRADRVSRALIPGRDTDIAIADVTQELSDDVSGDHALAGCVRANAVDDRLGSC